MDVEQGQRNSAEADVARSTHREGSSVEAPSDVLERLSHSAVLAALPPEEVLALVPLVRREHVPAGTRVLEEGAIGDALYILEEGRAHVSRGKAGNGLAILGPGDVFGEMALLSGGARSASVTAETALELWRLPKEDFERVVAASPALKQALEALAERHRAGAAMVQPDSLRRGAWKGIALRTLAARHRGLEVWQSIMAFGFVLWALITANESQHWLPPEQSELLLAGLQLLAGLAVIQGSCEAFILAVERLGARLRWEGFLSGTVGSVVATLPEFVVIGFLVAVQPLAAFVTAAVTIFNNAVAFSIYSFFLPKDQKGQFLMPRSLAKAGGEVLVAGSAIALIVGLLMLDLPGRGGGGRRGFVGFDLLLLGGVLIAIYGYYTYTLVRYYATGEDEGHPSVPPNPDRLGHDTGWDAIGYMFGLGILGAYVGGESIGGFADTALNSLGLPTIPTAAALAFFAGISEYIIVFKAHRRGELGIALSNVFGGMTQVMFLLLPAAMIAIGLFGLVTGGAQYQVPFTAETTMLMLLLFPLFYVLLEFVKDDHTLSNLDAAAMTGIYALLLYFLFTLGG